MKRIICLLCLTLAGLCNASQGDWLIGVKPESRGLAEAYGLTVKRTLLGGLVIQVKGVSERQALAADPRVRYVVADELVWPAASSVRTPGRPDPRSPIDRATLTRTGAVPAGRLQPAQQAILFPNDPLYPQLIIHWGELKCL